MNIGTIIHTNSTILTPLSKYTVIVTEKGSQGNIPESLINSTFITIIL